MRRIFASASAAAIACLAVLISSPNAQAIPNGWSGTYECRSAGLLGSKIAFLFLVTKDQNGKIMSATRVGLCRAGSEWAIGVPSGPAGPKGIDFATLPTLKPIDDATAQQIAKEGKPPRGMVVFEREALSKDLAKEAAKRFPKKK